MSVLTKEAIIERVKKKEIVISPYADECIGPASYDLHLGNVFRVFKKMKGVLKVEDHMDFDAISELVTVQDHFLLMPGETVHGITQEKITLPSDICSWLEGRSSLGRLGLGVHITAGFNHPGMDAKEVLEITNLGPIALELKPGLKICQMVFEECLGNAHYDGRFVQQETP